MNGVCNCNGHMLEGYQVRMRFDAVGSEKVMAALQSMLISAYLDSTFSAQTGGEGA